MRINIWTAVLAAAALPCVRATQQLLHDFSTSPSTSNASNISTSLPLEAQQTDGLQDLVTWDEHSLFIRGERIIFFSGEFHPFRLPVPTLWLDILQKIKSLGFTGVSFYTDWALLEGRPGFYSASGIFDLEPFFAAAQTAGIYLLARPGPYINAEVSGGGFPGWLQRNPAIFRTRDPRFLNATDLYMREVSRLFAKYQIINGGPIVLVQVENEYSIANPLTDPEFPDAVYFTYIRDQIRAEGVTVPLINNDNFPLGNFADGPPKKPGALDIYGYDGYPLGFDCATPSDWPDGALPTYYGVLHDAQSISTPHSIIEFQGGSFDSWGGSGFDNCALLTGADMENVFYKNDLSFGVVALNLYMIYGGTNWGNLGYPDGYTSYDYGAAISEDRSVGREKYAAVKLIANFLAASPAYLVATPQSNTFSAGQYTGNLAVFTTALLGNTTNFFVVRQTNYNSLNTQQYSITLPTTSRGDVKIPQLGNGSLSLHGRDSKIFVTDYDVGGVTLLYSTAEIFTWKKYGDERVLVVYAGPGEESELAVIGATNATLLEGEDVQFAERNGTLVIDFASSPVRRIVQLDCQLTIHIVDRQTAYDYWVIDLPNDPVSGNYTNSTLSTSAPIIKGGYLIRTVSVTNTSIHITGDLNRTTTIEVIGALPSPLKTLTFNNHPQPFSLSLPNTLTFTAPFHPPTYTLPDLTSLPWKTLDSLPELHPTYNDSLWPSANLTHSNNTAAPLLTPTSLFASDYGFNTGTLIFRGHFLASGLESFFSLTTQGGYAYAHSLWLNSTFLGSFPGAADTQTHSQTFSFPTPLTKNTPYVLTLVLDTTGNPENGLVGVNSMAQPRGILDYALSARLQTDISWKLTGNFGGEHYADLSRGPLNEGGLSFERHGFHLPGSPTQKWPLAPRGPASPLSRPGVRFYAVSFPLDIPTTKYDISLALNLSFPTSIPTTNSSSSSSSSSAFRTQLSINGFQYAKYLPAIGPQTLFPVPPGIWNYHGENYLGVSVWAYAEEGLPEGGPTVEVVCTSEVQSLALRGLETVKGERWRAREGVY